MPVVLPDAPEAVASAPSTGFSHPPEPARMGCVMLAVGRRCEVLPTLKREPLPTKVGDLLIPPGGPPRDFREVEIVRSMWSERAPRRLSIEDTHLSGGGHHFNFSGDTPHASNGVDDLNRSLAQSA